MTDEMILTKTEKEALKDVWRNKIWNKNKIYLPIKRIYGIFWLYNVSSERASEILNYLIKQDYIKLCVSGHNKFSIKVTEKGIEFFKRLVLEDE